MSRLKGDKEEGAKEEDNAMYQLSRLQRAKALEMLKIAKIAGQLEPDKADSVEMDMTLGATLMLSIRDVGCQGGKVGGVESDVLAIIFSLDSDYRDQQNGKIRWTWPSV